MTTSLGRDETERSFVVKSSLDIFRLLSTKASWTSKVREVDDRDVARVLHECEEAKREGELGREARGGGGGGEGELRRRRPTCTTNHNLCLHLYVPCQEHLTMLV